MDFNREFLAADALSKLKYEFNKALTRAFNSRYNISRHIDDLFIRYVFDTMMFSRDKFDIKNFKISYDDIIYLKEQHNLPLPSERDIFMIGNQLRSIYNNSMRIVRDYNVQKVIKNGYITYNIYPENRNIQMMRYTVERFNDISRRYTGNINDFDKYMALLTVRYSILGTENQHLSFPPSIMKKLNVNVELFGTPLNVSSSRFCSPFPDIERYFGSIGNFFHTNMKSSTVYTFDPPYVEELMDNATERLLSQLDKINNFIVIVNIPVWDSETQRKYDFKDYHMRFKTYEMLRDSKYLHSETVAYKFKNKYYNYFTNTYIPVSNTHLMILTDRRIKYNAESLREMWENLHN